MTTERRIEVVAGAIVSAGHLFATQRGYGPWAGWWEFPGGKLEAGESPVEALRRELREELSLEVEVLSLVATVDYDYPDFHLTMHLYHCRPLGTPTLLEHSASRWIGPADLQGMQWLPADLQVLPQVAKLLVADSHAQQADTCGQDQTVLHL